MESDNNKELIATELEALSMTLTDKELIVESDPGGGMTQLVLTRVTSNDDWK